MLKYEIKKNKIIVLNPQEFDVVQTLDCGQIFRFQIDKNKAKVMSKDKIAVLTSEADKIVIETTDVKYFENFFDLKTDYEGIKNQLKKDNMLSEAVEYGGGIRILNNDCFEMLVSFIISANNNISRIKKSIEYLCLNFGSNLGNYFAFPTLKQLKTATIDDFMKAGLGYRAPQMFETINKLTEEEIESLKTKSQKEQMEFLVSLKGIGEKVANCVMLFGLGVKNVFPVDTWINKVYNNLAKTKETNRAKITKELTEKYGNLSGYAQQYFYYYFRDNKIK